MRPWTITILATLPLAWLLLVPVFVATMETAAGVSLAAAILAAVELPIVATIATRRNHVDGERATAWRLAIILLLGGVLRAGVGFLGFLAAVARQA